MKTYNLTQLIAAAKEQGYKMAALENINGERVVSFNPLKTKIDAHLRTIFTRLKSDINPDGVYNVLMSHSIAKTKTPDRYPIKKGNVKESELAEAASKQQTNTVTIVEKQPNVLSWEKALEYQQKIAELTTKNAQLLFENSQLQAQLEEMEEEEEESGLSNPGKGNDIAKFMQETLPSLMPLADRYFDLEERKLEMQAGRLNGKKPSVNGSKRKIDKIILPGSQEQINLIKHYFDNNQDTKLQAELDKLERANQQLHDQVCEQLGIEFEEEEEEEGGTGAD